VISTFGQRFVKAGVFATSHQRALQSAFDDRSEGDYMGILPSREAVEHRRQEAQDLVEVISNFLKGKRVLP
jgi:uncharacterized protein (UPF0332 family)